MFPDIHVFISKFCIVNKFMAFTIYIRLFMSASRAKGEELM